MSTCVCMRTLLPFPPLPPSSNGRYPATVALMLYEARRGASLRFLSLSLLHHPLPSSNAGQLWPLAAADARHRAPPLCAALPSLIVQRRSSTAPLCAVRLGVVARRPRCRLRRSGPFSTLRQAFDDGGGGGRDGSAPNVSDPRALFALPCPLLLRSCPWRPLATTPLQWPAWLMSAMGGEGRGEGQQRHLCSGRHGSGLAAPPLTSPLSS